MNNLSIHQNIDLVKSDFSLDLSCQDLTPQSSVLATALYYQEQDLSIIPVSIDKVPLVRWKRYQSKVASPNQIRSWFSRFPNANIGIVTGTVSGIVVLDFDSVDIFNDFKHHFNLSNTLTVATSRGMHVYLSIDKPIGNIDNAWFEVSGDGGYIVALGSIHKSGCIYSIINPTPIAPLHDKCRTWLEDMHAQYPRANNNQKSQSNRRAISGCTQPADNINRLINSIPKYLFNDQLIVDIVSCIETRVEHKLIFSSTGTTPFLSFTRTDDNPDISPSAYFNRIGGFMHDDGTQEHWSINDLIDLLKIDKSKYQWIVKPNPEFISRERGCSYS